MLFSSIPFLYYFLPCVLLVYFLVPRRLKNTVLLLSSLFFYAWGEPRFVVFMLIAIVQGYVFGLLVEKFRNGRGARLCLALSAVISLGLLAYCKYADFFISSFNALTGLSIPLLKVSLPIGISFYTFQILSYVIDVYRGDVPAQRNFIDLAAYVAMFPQLIAGPIVQYKTVAYDLEHRRENLAEASEGLQRLVIGLGKKVLIANQMGAIWEEIAAMSDPTAATAWLGAIAYTFQIYFDFSGYSDMAIGLGHFFGFHFLENFNYPYESRSVTEFWRRWHISLSTWFREYVYIPLGGNRKGKGRQLVNIAIVWLLTGLWHGASWNFVLWGVYYAVLLLLEKTFLLKWLDKAPRFVGHVYTCLCFVLGWVLFAITDFSALGAYLGHMFSGAFADGTTAYLLRCDWLVLALAVVGCTSLPRRLWEKRERAMAPALSDGLRTVWVAVVLLVSIAFLVGDSYNPFLYFRF